MKLLHYGKEILTSFDLRVAEINVSIVDSLLCLPAVNLFLVLFLCSREWADF